MLLHFKFHMFSSVLIQVHTFTVSTQNLAGFQLRQRTVKLLTNSRSELREQVWFPDHCTRYSFSVVHMADLPSFFDFFQLRAGVLCSHTHVVSTFYLSSALHNNQRTYNRKNDSTCNTCNSLPIHSTNILSPKIV